MFLTTIEEIELEPMHKFVLISIDLHAMIFVP